MKTLLSLLTIVLVTANANGQSEPLKRKYKAMELNDTAYMYVFKRFTNSDGKIIVWSEDLQTGNRFEQLVDCKLPKGQTIEVGTIYKVLKTEMIIEPITKRRRNS